MIRLKAIMNVAQQLEDKIFILKQVEESTCNTLAYMNSVHIRVNLITLGTMHVIYSIKTYKHNPITMSIKEETKL